MAIYLVRLPVVMLVTKQVETDDEQNAIDEAISNDTLDIDLMESSKSNGWEIEEWEVFEKIVEGNVVYTYNHTAKAEVIGE